MFKKKAHKHFNNLELIGINTAVLATIELGFSIYRHFKKKPATEVNVKVDVNKTETEPETEVKTEVKNEATDVYPDATK